MSWRCPKCGAHLVLAIASEDDRIHLREDRREDWRDKVDDAYLREAKRQDEAGW